MRKTISALPDANPSYRLNFNQTPLAQNDSSHHSGHLPSARHSHHFTGRSSRSPSPCPLGKRGQAACYTNCRRRERRWCRALLLYGHPRRPLGPLDLIRAHFLADAYRAWRTPHKAAKGRGRLHSKACAPASPVPFAACCCSRILRVRGVVPLGMLMMYFPSISAVTRRRLVGTARLSSSRRARAAGEEGVVSIAGMECSPGVGARRLAKGTNVPFISIRSNDCDPLFPITPSPLTLSHQELPRPGHNRAADGAQNPHAVAGLLGSRPPSLTRAGGPPSPARIPSEGETLGAGKVRELQLSNGFTGVIVF